MEFAVDDEDSGCSSFSREGQANRTSVSGSFALAVAEEGPYILPFCYPLIPRRLHGIFVEPGW